MTSGASSSSIRCASTPGAPRRRPKLVDDVPATTSLRPSRASMRTRTVPPPSNTCSASRLGRERSAAIWCVTSSFVIFTWWFPLNCAGVAAQQHTRPGDGRAGRKAPRRRDWLPARVQSAGARAREGSRSAASESQGSLLVGRLSVDGELARHAAFALFVRVYLEHSGLITRLVLDAPARAGRITGGLPDAIAAIQEQNPHLVSYFADPQRRDALASLDEGATQELLGWLRAQHVEQEEPQIAYELGMLALGVELPPILVRGLREAQVEPDTRVVELPDGSGYAAVFLSTLHPAWRGAGHLTLFVESVDAEQLARLGHPPDRKSPCPTARQHHSRDARGETVAGQRCV